jgi:hypothetical protein
MDMQVPRDTGTRCMPQIYAYIESVRTQGKFKRFGGILKLGHQIQRFRRIEFFQGTHMPDWRNKKMAAAIWKSV